MQENQFNDVVIGVLLGDASIQKNTSKSQEKWRLKFSQQIKQKGYRDHLHEFFGDYVRAKPFYNEKRKMYSFQTLFNSRFNEFAKMFINEQGIKRVPKQFSTVKISPRTLAYWFMDDGGSNSYNPRRGIQFNTQSFTRTEVEILINTTTQTVG